MGTLSDIKPAVVGTACTPEQVNRNFQKINLMLNELNQAPALQKTLAAINQYISTSTTSGSPFGVGTSNCGDPPAIFVIVRNIDFKKGLDVTYAGNYAIVNIQPSDFLDNITAAQIDDDVDTELHLDDDGEACNKIKPYIDLSAWPGYDADEIQVPYKPANGKLTLETLVELLKLLPGWNADNPQSIGHDAAGDPEWQDDGDCDEEE